MRVAATIGIVVSLVAAGAHAQTQTLSDVEFLRRASDQVRQYADTFHDLTAQETATTVASDLHGTPGPERTVVSSLIIYRSQSDAKQWVEYRDVESVDGKRVKDHEKRAIELLEKMTDTKSAADELDRITKEGNRYNQQVSTVNMTLKQGLPLLGSCVSAFQFRFLRNEDIGEFATRVFGYEQVRPCENFHYRLSLPYAFENGPRTHRGTLWLDASTSQLVREEREIYVENKDNAAIRVKVVHMVFQYQTSSFGILVPSRISIRTFRILRFGTGIEPVTMPKVSFTQSYGPFSRFEVSVEQKINEPKEK